jgi:hypothetical protein
MGEKGKAYGALMGKSGGKELLGTPRCTWEDNIKIYLREICDGMDWIPLYQDKGY